MTARRSVAGAGATLCAGLALAGQAAADRPGPGAGYEPDVELLSHASAGGEFLIWYVTASPDAVAPDDVAPADGVPDLVAEAAAAADESRRVLVDDRGFRPPLVDAEVLPPDEVGGDARFDIYLIDFGQADGHYQPDACMDSPSVCVGHALIENDFAESSYPSLAIAARVVVSHEYFHAVQAAYDSDQDIKWREGTAVWAEEVVFPEQDDYERLVAHFLAKPFRAFDRPSGGSFGDLYPYGAALWPTFLDQRYGPTAVAQVWEACEDRDGDSPDFLTAAERVLTAQYGTSLQEAWLEFTRWNLFTGPRADPSRAYAGAQGWASVALEDEIAADADGRVSASAQIDGLSARYVPIALPDLGGAPRRLSLVSESGAAVAGTAYLAGAAGIGEALSLVPGSGDGSAAAEVSLDLQWTGTPTLFVVVTGITRGAPMQGVQIDLAPVPRAPEPPSLPAASGCGVAPGAGHSPAPAALVIALTAVAAAAAWRPRARRSRAR